MLILFPLVCHVFARGIRDSGQDSRSPSTSIRLADVRIDVDDELLLALIGEVVTINPFRIAISVASQRTRCAESLAYGIGDAYFKRRRRRVHSAPMPSRARPAGEGM